MQKNKLFQKKHELWLSIAYSLYPIKDSRIVNVLHSFAETEFRHLKWLGEQIVEDIQSYDYDNHAITQSELPKMFNFERDVVEVKWEKGIDLLEQIKRKFSEISKWYDSEDSLQKRMLGDERYYSFRIEQLLGEYTDLEIRESFKEGAFNYQKRVGLSDDEMKLMVDTLKSQQDKEYKTVLSFYYVLVHTAKTEISEIFADLLYESLSHQHHYARMLALMGIVETPTILKPEDYQVSDIKSFIMSSIDEEQVEIVDLQKIAESVPFQDFQKLVEYVSNQENYHIELLKKAYKLID